MSGAVNTGQLLDTAAEPAADTGYLLCERDVPRTSEMLIIHRSTLLYRLKKINALVNLNLDDPNQRVYLLLSLWVLDRGIPVPPEKDGDEKAQKPLLSVENYDMMYSD